MLKYWRVSYIFIFSDVFMMGGISGTSASNETTLYDDIWKFSLTEATWFKYPTALSVPLYFHSSDFVQVGSSLNVEQEQRE